MALTKTEQELFPRCYGSSGAAGRLELGPIRKELSVSAAILDEHVRTLDRRVCVLESQLVDGLCCSIGLLSNHHSGGRQTK
jgi:hypothetical protein